LEHEGIRDVSKGIQKFEKGDQHKMTFVKKVASESPRTAMFSWQHRVTEAKDIHVL